MKISSRVISRIVKHSRYLSCLLVRPGKTGSTMMQKLLTQLQNNLILEKDNFIYLGRYIGMGGDQTYTSFLNVSMNYCHWKMHEMSPSIGEEEKRMRGSLKRARPFINKLYDQRKNVIVYEEFLTSCSFPTGVFLQAIQKKFRVRIVIGYRRYYQWLLSFKNQMEKKGTFYWPIKRNTTLNNDNIIILPTWGPGENRSRTLPTPPYIRFFTTNNDMTKKWTYGVIQRYQSWHDHANIQILNMHHPSGDMAQHFLCDILPNAKHSCCWAKQVGSKNDHHHTNPSLDMNWDLIAVEAADRGLLDTTQNRPSVVRSIRECHKERQEIQQSSQDDGGAQLPLECLDRESSEDFVEKSIQLEREVLSIFNDTTPDLGAFLVPEEEEKHRHEFWNSTWKFCSANIGTIMKDPFWLDCFARIKNMNH
jgi:hypothetical protein